MDATEYPDARINVLGQKIMDATLGSRYGFRMDVTTKVQIELTVTLISRRFWHLW